MIVSAAGSFVICFRAEPEAGLPEELTPRETQIAKSTHPDEILDGGPLE
jgi:hypothetical protein